MASSKLKIGMVGGGSISDLHLEAYSAHSNSSIIGICDRNLERARAKAESYQAPFFCSDHHHLLAQPEIDAVVICTWNHTHADIAISALEAGKHVFVEKPLSTNLEDALRIQNAVKSTGKKLQVGFVRRFDPNVQVLRKFIAAGDLGEIYYAKASALRRLGNPGGWFAKKEISGGGPLIDTGIHVIDTCWYLMGRPKAVSVSGNTYYSLGSRANVENLSFYKAADYDPATNDVEDMANALIRFENGASLFIDTSYTLHARENVVSMKLYGEHGGAEIEPEFWMVSEKHGTILNVQPQTDYLRLNIKQAFENQVNHFIEYCLHDKTTEAPVEDGVEIMRVLSAIYESGRTGKEIVL
ncbi:Gfo/Idh/MocA family oxidoreductase [Bacillus sp. REN3]|uniref:Gfo/Idh/MocA family protein n=1 Tax=Bacillus sp. REN3 TaxID=2802440 RepID=UPI001AEE3626|nr:Gfo/Idh/MocA family oxidoreductase [Bacillus sp. REN3]